MIKGKFEFRVEAGFNADNVREIYEGGVPSSITLDSSMSEVWRPLHTKFDGKYHPADWYSHCPNTSIAYLRAFGPYTSDKGKIVARTIVYHDAKGRPIEYGPMYAGDNLFYSILCDLLDKQGIRRLHQGSRWLVTSPFTVQGFKLDNKDHPWVCPFPFLDVMNGPWFSVDRNGLFTFGQHEHLLDRGLKHCYRVQVGGPSHYGVLSSKMHSGVPSDNAWLADRRR